MSVVSDEVITNASIQKRLVIPSINLNGPANSIVPKGFPGGIAYEVNHQQIYYSNGNGWSAISGGGAGSSTDAFIFYDPTSLASGGGWGATGPSSNMDINPTDPQITTPSVIWSTMYSSGNASMDGATGTLTIINSGLYKVNFSISVIAVAPVAPTTITVLFYGGAAPPLTYFATQTLSSNVVGFNASGTLTSTSMRMWDAGFQLPLKFNWFVSGSATFIFSPLQISLERIGDYSAVPPYP